MKKAILTNLRAFLAIIALLFLGLTTATVILVRQGTPLPSWLPGIGQSRFELHAQFTSAQAVTPGQGQTITIAGIKVGEVDSVALRSGTADVTMGIEPKYAPLIHSDATLLLRPRTGLQDMAIEVNPGHRGPEIPEGSTVPLAQTTTPVQPDQILATLDGDTRQYLQLLLAAGGQGLGGNGKALSATLRRLDPTARDLAKVNGALARRRQNIARVITNLRLLSEALGRGDTQLSQFVDSSNRVLGSFANQQQALRSAIGQLPNALSATRSALASADQLSLVLGPTSRALLPSARALAPALRQTRPFFRRTTPSIRDQIRPFTRQVRAPIHTLSRTSTALRGATPTLTGALGRLNSLLNALAFNPPGKQESSLFWLAWFNHDTNSVFSLQDAQGPLPRGLVLQSCQTAQNAEALTAGRPFLKTVQQITRVPTSSTICPLTP